MESDKKEHKFISVQRFVQLDLFFEAEDMVGSIKKEPKFRSVKRAYDYACGNGKLNLNNEKLISNNSKYSLLYAKYVLFSRFELGEEVISKSAFDSYEYAKCVLRSRFELGEEAISKSQHYSYFYASKVLEGRFELGEREMVKHPFNRYFFYYLEAIFKHVIPIDFLELISIENLEFIVHCTEDIKNIDDIIKVLFKKKFLEDK